MIGIYDTRHTIVPNGLSYAVAFLAFILLFFDVTLFAWHIPSLSALFAGPLVASPLFFLWLISNGKWMGLGDAKLMLSIGWILGIAGGGVALLIAFWSGALFGVVAILLKSPRIQHFFSLRGESMLPLSLKRLTIKSEIPFAPFLLLGFFITLLCNLTIDKLFLWPL